MYIPLFYSDKNDFFFFFFIYRSATVKVKAEDLVFQIHFLEMLKIGKSVLYIFSKEANSE